MAENAEILDTVRKALQSEARVDLPHHPIRLGFADGDLTMEGEVADIAAKKLALERAAAVPDVQGIVDRLRVSPAERMEDGQIRDLVAGAVAGEPALANCTVRLRVKNQWKPMRVVEAPVGNIDVAIENGVVTLDGDVPGLGLKRLTGVLAWWVPGSRDVVNGLGVTSPEADNDDEITDAVRMAFERDPFVNPDQLRITTHDSVVTLQGLVPTESEREMAEFDAWYVFGVDKVVNEIQVHA